MFVVCFDNGCSAIWSSDQISSYYDNDDGYNAQIVSIEKIIER